MWQTVPVTQLNRFEAPAQHTNRQPKDFSKWSANNLPVIYHGGFYPGLSVTGSCYILFNIVYTHYGGGLGG